MSFTARPSFAGGMSNQNQQQQQGGQPNNSNIGASGIPNLINNAAAIPGNHLSNPSSSSALLTLTEQQKLFQQQIILQRQLINQHQQYQQQQQQTSQQNQQTKFQQQPNQQQANFTRIMTEMLSEKNGSNVAQQSQQLQQFVQLQALSNIMQMQQEQAQQQKSFQQQQQQQSVPLPTNTTITPVARQNMQAMQKQPANYPRSNVHNKNVSQNASSSPMQSRKSFPNAPKSAVPQMQSGMVAAPLNISGSSSKSIMPQIPSVMASATNSPKGYADFLSLSNAQSSLNITPSLTITKTTSPSGSKNSGNLTNKSISSNPLSQKSFLSEAISMSLGNVPISVKSSQSPSVTVTPTNKPTSSPTNKTIPITPLKIIPPPNVPFMPKLSPTSPRTKQTPRKNTNPIRTTSLSPATQTSSQSVVPQVDSKASNSSGSIALSTVKPTVSQPVVANASSIKVPTVNLVPSTPPKANIAASVSAAAIAKTPPKPIQLTPAGNSNLVSPKPLVATPKIETARTPTSVSASTTKLSTIPPKPIKTESAKSIAVKVETPVKVNPEKVAEAVKIEKSSPIKSAVASATPTNKPAESKTKSVTPLNASISNNANESVSKEKDNKESTASNAAKSIAEQVTKTPVAKIEKATSSTSTPAKISAPTISSAEGRSKRNRFKTIPYQSPTPEIELVSKISAVEAMNVHKKKAVDEDKLTLFYKSEFLAVRNADGGFFLCQAMNNVYKSSPKIRIRWLSEDTTNKSTYSLDFYDHTDIECVLTSVSLNKMAKGKYELTKTECDRIENILKKALDVEKGIVDRPDPTEENPDGLDLSLYKDESQIEKKTPAKRKANDKSDSATIDVKKRRTDTAKDDQLSAKKSKSMAKPKLSPSKLAKTPVKTASQSPKKSETSVQSTPITKRAATKRNLTEEATDAPDKEDIANKDGSNDEPSAKVSKLELEPPKQSSEKASGSTSAESAAQSGRTTRRSRN